jgi:hypothetical protein
MRFIREESIRLPLSYEETIPKRKFKEDMDEEQKRSINNSKLDRN